MKRTKYVIEFCTQGGTPLGVQTVYAFGEDEALILAKAKQAQAGLRYDCHYILEQAK